METVLIIITAAMFLLAMYGEGRRHASAGLRAVSWEEFARRHRLEIEGRDRQLG